MPMRAKQSLLETILTACSVEYLHPAGQTSSIILQDKIGVMLW